MRLFIGKIPLQKIVRRVAFGPINKKCSFLKKANPLSFTGVPLPHQE